MKTKIFTFLVVLIGGLFMATSAFADNETSVSPGQTITYSIKQTFSSYAWKVTTDAAYTTDAATSEYTLTETGQSVTILWKAPSAGKTYYVSVQGTDSKNCLSERISKTVVVTSPTVCIADASTFNGISTSEPTGTASDNGVCSLIFSSPVTTGASTTVAGQTEFYATLAGGINGVKYAFKYQVGSNAEVTTSEVTAGTGGYAVLKITIDATTYPSDFYAPTSDKSVIVKVTGLVVGGETINATCGSTKDNYTVKVNQLPTISF